MAQSLPESLLRYMSTPFVANRRGDALRTMDNQQLLNLLVNKPNFMTPQEWHANGGQNFDPDGSLYAQYLAMRADKGLSITPAEKPQKPQMQANPNYVAPEGMDRASRRKLEDSLAASQQPPLVTPSPVGSSSEKTSAVIPQMKANADYEAGDTSSRAERAKRENELAVSGQNVFNQQRNAVGTPTAGTYTGTRNALGRGVDDISSYVENKLDKFKNSAFGSQLINWGDPSGQSRAKKEAQSAAALDAAEMGMQPSKLAAPYVPPPSAPTSAPATPQTTAAPPVAQEPVATAPKLDQAAIDRAVANSGDMTFGRQALTPRAEGSYSSRVTTSGTNQPTRTQSQQMYYYDPGDGGPVRMMGTSLPKGMSSGSQQGGGYIFGLDQPQNRTTAQKVVQGDASGVASSVGDFFNKLTAKKPGTVDPLTGRTYEPVQQSDNVQAESRGGKVHNGSATHDSKCHVGIIHMAVGGRTDHLPMNVYANSYVIPADVVSGLGEGNTLSGGKILDHMFSGDSLQKLVNKSVKVPRKAGGGPLPISMPAQMGNLQVMVPDVPNFGPMELEKSGPFGAETVTARANPRFPEPRYSWRYSETPPGEKPKAGAARGGLINDRSLKPVEILAAGGEYVVPPEVIRALGHGDPEDGHKWMDNFVKSSRAHIIKTMQKLPGPKKD